MQPVPPAPYELVQQLFERAVAVWSKPGPIHDSPSWNGRPEARALCEALAQRIPESDAFLGAGLGHENQHVVAYCLLALDLALSPKLLRLPDTLQHDRRHVTIIRGSFATKVQICDLARQLTKKQRNAEPSAPPNGGPATQLGDSGAKAGPPSVS